MNSEDLIYGLHSVLEAVNSNVKISKVIVRQGLTGNLASELMGTLKFKNIPFQHVPAEVFNKYKNKNHQGVVAFTSPIELQNLEELLPQLLNEGKTPFILMLDRVTDVRNFGAIVRTAECAGVDIVVVPAKGAANIGSDAVKTSAGALHHIPVCRVGSLKMTANYLKQNGVKVISATEKAEKTIFESSLNGPVALVMGAEDTGISPDVIKLSDEVVKIPINGKIGSLNVSVATGIVLYEIVRQRGL
ncbi:MAG: 23S rRNA (guanosine(2251)-2'-O)-methyltransferase RlmB [Bacteroidales bacterium]